MIEFKNLLAILMSMTFVAMAFTPVALVAANRCSTRGNQNDVSYQVDRKIIAQMTRKDHSIKKFFDKAYGYALFPAIGESVAMDGDYGHGTVYKHHCHIGYTEISRFYNGAVVGGRWFSEVIFFKNKAAFQSFIKGDFQFDNHASAVEIKASATKTNSFRDGIAVFTMTSGGLGTATYIAGQKFSYLPVASSYKPAQ